MSHRINTVAKINTSNPLNVKELLNGIENAFKKERFRYEFDNDIVLAFDTGKTFIAEPNDWYNRPGEHPIHEYMIIRSTSNGYKLCDYYGPVGSTWEGEHREQLIKNFQAQGN